MSSPFPKVDKTSLSAVVASGDILSVSELLKSDVDLNELSAEGFAPLCIASFWGYADIVKLLLQHGANVNVTNKGTGWTPCHCAAFQGHGKVLLYLTQHDPDLSIKDSAGRLASDFGSALDSMWPFFAAKGCKRTSKAELIRMDIIKKVVSSDNQQQPAKGGDASLKKVTAAHFSRPGSAYVVKLHPQTNRNPSQSSLEALAYGDVLREDDSRPDYFLNQQMVAKERKNEKIQLNMWRT